MVSAFLVIAHQIWHTIWRIGIERYVPAAFTFAVDLSPHFHAFGAVAENGGISGTTRQYHKERNLLKEFKEGASLEES